MILPEEAEVVAAAGVVEVGAADVVGGAVVTAGAVVDAGAVVLGGVVGVGVLPEQAVTVRKITSTNSARKQVARDSLLFFN